MTDENMNVRDMSLNELKRFAVLGDGQRRAVERELHRRWDSFHDVSRSPFRSILDDQPRRSPPFPMGFPMGIFLFAQACARGCAPVRGFGVRMGWTC